MNFDNELNNSNTVNGNEDFDESLWADLEDMRELITITDDEGNETELCVIDAVLHDGINYLLCIESSINASEAETDAETEAYIFKEIIESDGTDGSADTMNLSLIEDDDEYNRIIQLFQNDDYELIE